MTETAEKHNLKVAMLLASSSNFNPGSLQSAAKSQWTHPFEFKLENGQNGVGLFSLDFGDFTVNGVHIPVPIPKSEIDGAPPPPWSWPKFEEDFPKHPAHFIVTVSRPQGTPIEMAMDLTKALLAVADSCSFMAAYWGDAPLFTRADLFRVHTIDLSRKPLPLAVWVACCPITRPMGVGLLRTYGMKQFDVPEIETPITKAPMTAQVGFVYDLAHYNLTSGTNMKNGDTVDGTSGRLRISHVFDTTDGRKIMSLTPA